MFTVSNSKQAYCILNNWCICINLSCGFIAIAGSAVTGSGSTVTVSQPYESPLSKNHSSGEDTEKKTPHQGRGTSFCWNAPARGELSCSLQTIIIIIILLLILILKLIILRLLLLLLLLLLQRLFAKLTGSEGGDGEKSMCIYIYIYIYIYI